MSVKILTIAISAFLLSTAVSGQMFNKKATARAGETDYIIIPDSLGAMIPGIKKETRKNLEPYRYDASKTSYFVYKTFNQNKEVEVFYFSSNEYKMAFNGEAVLKPIRVEIYDKPKQFKNRTLLYSKDNVSTGIFHVTSTELEQNLKTKKVEAGMTETEAAELTLKKVYINYIIPSKEKEVSIGENGQRLITKTKGAIVMSMGYKNI